MSATDRAQDWSFAAVHDVLAAAVPDRAMLVCGEVRRSFREVFDRSRSLAAWLLARRGSEKVEVV